VPSDQHNSRPQAWFFPCFTLLHPERHTAVHTVPPKRNIALARMSQFAHVKGCGTHFAWKYCWSICKDGYLQAKQPFYFKLWANWLMRASTTLCLSSTVLCIFMDLPMLFFGCHLSLLITKRVDLVVASDAIDIIHIYQGAFQTVVYCCKTSCMKIAENEAL